MKVFRTEFNVNSDKINQTIFKCAKVNVLLKESRDEINLFPNEEVVWNLKNQYLKEILMSNKVHGKMIYSFWTMRNLKTHLPKSIYSMGQFYHQRRHNQHI
jgi:hypothetical protein